MAESTDWLKTQTRARLEKEPPEKLAPPDVGSYSLVLLRRGTDHDRLAHLLERIMGKCDDISAACPLVVKRHISLSEARLWQFELICCDSVSVFLRDEVVSRAPRAYLHELYCHLLGSDEFAPVVVELPDVPDTDAGRRYLLQFFGQFIGVGKVHTVTRKKARIMADWGAKFDVHLQVGPQVNRFAGPR